MMDEKLAKLIQALQTARESEHAALFRVTNANSELVRAKDDLRFCKNRRVAALEALDSYVAKTISESFVMVDGKMKPKEETADE